MNTQDSMMYYYGIGNGWLWHGMLGPVFMVLFWGIVIVGIVWLVRNGPKYWKHHNQKPIDILKERYAKGEISKEQFEAMKKDIEN